MREAVVVGSSRTALAKSFRGSFNLTRSEDLAAHCIRHVLGKTPELAPAEIPSVKIELTCFLPCVTIRPMIAGSRCVHCGTACLDSGPIAITVWPYPQKKY
jgi:hypothetical protein